MIRFDSKLLLSTNGSAHGAPIDTTTGSRCQFGCLFVCLVFGLVCATQTHRISFYALHLCTRRTIRSECRMIRIDGFRNSRFYLWCGGGVWFDVWAKTQKSVPKPKIPTSLDTYRASHWVLCVDCYECIGWCQNESGTDFIYHSLINQQKSCCSDRSIPILILCRTRLHTSATDQL